MTFTQQLAYRAKAILAGLAVAVVGLAEWAVTSPDLAAALQRILPDPWVQLVPVVLGAVGVLLVHFVPNTVPDAATALTTSAAADVPTDPSWTTVVKTQTTDGGEFNGDPAH